MGWPVLVEVRGGVPHRRAVATTDVTARRAPPQVHPRAADAQAVLASVRRRRGVGDGVEVTALRSRHVSMVTTICLSGNSQGPVTVHTGTVDAVKMDLPAPYVARPYRGRADHPVMASILGDYHQHTGSSALPTAEQIDANYANLVNCDPATDVVVIEADGDGPVAYVRVWWEDLADGTHDYVLFSPMRPEHIAEPLFAAMVAAEKSHLRRNGSRQGGIPVAHLRPHPGPGLEPTCEAAWLESLGYRPIRFEASLVRPHLEDIPELSLPEASRSDAVTPEMSARSWRRTGRRFVVVGLRRGRPRRASSGPSTIHARRRRCGRSRGSATPSSARSRASSTPTRTPAWATCAGTPSTSRPTPDGATGASPARCGAACVS